MGTGGTVKIGRVVGTVVSTISSPVFEGRRLLLCDLLDASGEPDGSYLICVDTVGSGAGEAVLILDEGNSARQVLGMSDGAGSSRRRRHGRPAHGGRRARASGGLTPLRRGPSGCPVRSSLSASSASDVVPWAPT